MRSNATKRRFASCFIWGTLLGLVSLTVCTAESGFNSRADTQMRLDERSANPLRMQYRVRWYPQYRFTDTRWTLNAFLSTGDNFSGSHNTFYPADQNHFYLRRAYLRYQASGSVTEIGVIPTFKGRVSSSGLSKNGFIQGIRHVIQPFERAKLEFVVGSLNDTAARNAFRLPGELDYLEMELSADVSSTSSFEASLEHMTGFNYLRTEYRFEVATDLDIFIEWVKRIDNLDDKFVLGTNAQFEVAGSPVSLHGYYSYVSEGVGARAELTEDFISTGHGLSIEMDTPLPSSPRWKAFLRFDGFRNNTRFILGLKVKI